MFPAGHMMCLQEKIKRYRDTLSVPYNSRHIIFEDLSSSSDQSEGRIHRCMFTSQHENDKCTMVSAGQWFLSFLVFFCLFVCSLTLFPNLKQLWTPH